MNASKLAAAQRTFILMQGEQGTPVAKICRKAGRGGSVYLNRFRFFSKWISAPVKPRPLRASVG